MGEPAGGEICMSFLGWLKSPDNGQECVPECSVYLKFLSSCQLCIYFPFQSLGALYSLVFVVHSNVTVYLMGGLEPG